MNVVKNTQRAAPIPTAVGALNRITYAAERFELQQQRLATFQSLVGIMKNQPLSVKMIRNIRVAWTVTLEVRPKIAKLLLDFDLTKFNVLSVTNRGEDGLTTTFAIEEDAFSS